MHFALMLYRLRFRFYLLQKGRIMDYLQEDALSFALPRISGSNMVARQIKVVSITLESSLV